MTRRKQTARPSEKLFAGAKRDMFEQSYEEKLRSEKNKPVECLGMTFPNEEERRKYFLGTLSEKLKDPEFRGPGWIFLSSWSVRLFGLQ
jgi:hypothetical protein